jgi:hypothetical protein
MSPDTETPREQASALDDIERRVREIFSAQKSKVEQSLVARINREKEEAQKRIEAVNQEFAQVRYFLEEHKTTMVQLQTLDEHLRTEIRGHFERAVNYQKMMEHAAVLAGNELEKIGALNDEIEKVRVKAETIYAGLRENLAGYAGIADQIPAPAAKPGQDLDWSAEIDKLRRVRDLLATLRPIEGFETGGDSAPYANDAPGREPISPAAETAAEELAASLGLIDPEDDGVHDDLEFAEGRTAAPAAGIPSLVEEAAEPETADSLAPAAGTAPGTAPEPDGAEPAAETAPAESAPEPAGEPEPTADGCQFAAPPSGTTAALESLARYRKTEPINNGIEISFYASETGAFLDADSFMAAIGKITEAANHLHAQLTQTNSVKDLFLLKQEILNQQEILRKLFFRVVRFVDKESGRLPTSLDEMVASRSLKDIIERLTMANWSDPTDFKPFLNELKAMERAFEARTGSKANYLQSVLDEVEGREN